MNRLVLMCASLLTILLPVLLFATETGSLNSANFATAAQGGIVIAEKAGVAVVDAAEIRPDRVVEQSVPATAYGNGNIDFYGTTTLQESGGIANITIDGIKNYSSSFTSGSLRIDLWALQAPYNGGAYTGYNTASIRTNQITGVSDTLGPGQYFYNISLHLPYTPPGNASYSYYTLFLQMYDSTCTGASDHYCTIAAVNLTSTSSVPVCSPTASPSSVPAAGGTVTLTANCSNGPTSYSWTNGGTVFSTNSSFSTTIPVNTTSTSKTYAFSLSASNAYGAGVGSVSIVQAAPAPGSTGVSAPAPNMNPCVRSATTACLLNGRFRVEANWSSSPSQGASPASVTYFTGSRAETDNAAVLWFQDPAFFEIGVTLYDGCSYGGTPYTWVFIGGLTDWSWAMTISDTYHGTYRQYSNTWSHVTQTTTDYQAFSCN
jgi:hypothetical protein